MASKKMSYIGGHPLGGDPSRGVLEIGTDNLTWRARKRIKIWRGLNLGWRKVDEQFEIPLENVVSVDSKTKRELQAAPQGYLTVLPGLAHGYWQDRRHPATPDSSVKLTALLLVVYTDEFGDQQTVAFGNWPTSLDTTDSLQDVANTIIAARYRRKKELSA